MVKLLSISLILLAIIAITYGRSPGYNVAIQKQDNTYERKDESGYEASLHLNIVVSSNSEDDNTSEGNTGEGNTGEGNTDGVENLQDVIKNLKEEFEATKSELKSAINATKSELESAIETSYEKLRPQSCSHIKDLHPEATTGRYVVYDNIFAIGKEVECDMSDEGVEMLIKNCKEILDNDPTSSNGVYTININPSTTIDVYCEMNEGGWTVFQKRFDGSEDFSRIFKEYSEGFGDPSQEHWLGLNNIHQLTSQPGYKSWILRVDLESSEGETAYAQYENFNVGAGTNYTLSIGSYSGTAGDSLTYSNGGRFSTYDRDQDEWSEGDCADRHNGAWWFRGCGHSNLNAHTYNDNRHSKGMNWYYWKNSWTMTMKSTVMKMKPIM